MVLRHRATNRNTHHGFLAGRLTRISTGGTPGGVDAGRDSGGEGRDIHRGFRRPVDVGHDSIGEKPTCPHCGGRGKWFTTGEHLTERGEQTLPVLVPRRRHRQRVTRCGRGTPGAWTRRDAPA